MKSNDSKPTIENYFVEIAYCFDKNYEQHFGVSLTSLLLNADFSNFKKRVHVIVDDLSQELSDKLSRLKNIFNVEIEIYKIDLNEFSNFNQLPINSKYISHTTAFTWARLFLPKILRSEISRVIYLDCDTIVLSDLLELYATDMKGHPIAGCLDINSVELSRRLNVDKYINAGVLLIDLDLWRKNDYSDRCVDYTIQIRDEIIFGDQCAINKFFADNIEVIEHKWNFYVLPEDNPENLDGMGILHYISARKPWQANYWRRNGRHYWRYLEISPWKEVKKYNFESTEKSSEPYPDRTKSESILPHLIEIYRSIGLEPLTGYNPLHFSNWEAAPFTRFVNNGQLVGIAGLALQEIMFLEGFSGLTIPRSILVIGNALGWSAVALALTFPHARVLTLDPDQQGNSITNQIAQAHNLNIKAITGKSPEDVASIINSNDIRQLDLCLIDGIHENQNLISDFSAIYDTLSSGALVLMHDVIDWNMMLAFEEIMLKQGIRGHLLTRTASGMGLVWKDGISDALAKYISAFTEPPALYKSYQALVRHSISRRAEAAITRYR
jgi:lipopolysaccharide biosynthesis glycosyltransferase